MPVVAVVAEHVFFNFVAFIIHRRKILVFFYRGWVHIPGDPQSACSADRGTLQQKDRVAIEVLTAASIPEHYLWMAEKKACGQKLHEQVKKKFH